MPNPYYHVISIRAIGSDSTMVHLEPDIEMHRMANWGDLHLPRTGLLKDAMPGDLLILGDDEWHYVPKEVAKAAGMFEPRLRFVDAGMNHHPNVTDLVK